MSPPVRTKVPQWNVSTSRDRSTSVKCLHQSEPKCLSEMSPPLRTEVPQWYVSTSQDQSTSVKCLHQSGPKYLSEMSTPVRIKVPQWNVSTNQDQSISVKCVNSSLTCRAAETCVLLPAANELNWGQKHQHMAHAVSQFVARKFGTDYIHDIIRDLSLSVMGQFSRCLKIKLFCRTYQSVNNASITALAVSPVQTKI